MNVVIKVQLSVCNTVNLHESTFAIRSIRGEFRIIFTNKIGLKKNSQNCNAQRPISTETVGHLPGGSRQEGRTGLAK